MIIKYILFMSLPCIMFALHHENDVTTLTKKRRHSGVSEIRSFLSSTAELCTKNPNELEYKWKLVVQAQDLLENAAKTATQQGHFFFAGELDLARYLLLRNCEPTNRFLAMQWTQLLQLARNQLPTIIRNGNSHIRQRLQTSSNLQRMTACIRSWRHFTTQEVLPHTWTQHSTLRRECDLEYAWQLFKIAQLQAPQNPEESFAHFEEAHEILVKINPDHDPSLESLYYQTKELSAETALLLMEASQK